MKALSLNRGLAAMCLCAGLACAVAFAQESSGVMPEIDTLPQGVQPDMKTVRNYYQNVDDRLKGQRERDPFQATPALRARRAPRGNGVFTPAPQAASFQPEASGELPWRLQALSLGGTPMAVVARQRTEGTRQRGGQDAARSEQRFLHVGDTMEVDDGRSYLVERIDRQGVLLRGIGAEEDLVRIR